MLSILIADDEEFMREYLSSLDWQSMGYSFVKIVENGLQALDEIEKCNGNIDVLLTDIRMPFLDGLELCRVVEEKYPLIYKLILTGYDEFEYAQKSIKYGVKEYILKPIIPKEMCDIMLKTKENVLKERDRNDYFKKIEQVFEENKPILRERFLLRLIKGQIQPQEVQHTTRLYDISLEGKSFTIAIMNFAIASEDDLKLNSEIISFAIYDFIKGQERQNQLFIAADSDDYVLLFIDKSSISIKSELQRILNQIKEKINISAFVSIGCEVKDIFELQNSYKTAINGRRYRFLYEDVQIIDYKDFANDNEEINVIDYNLDLERLVWEIKFGDEKGIEKEINLIFEKILNIKEVELIRLIAIDIIVEILKLHTILYDRSISILSYIGKIEKNAIGMNEIKKLSLKLALDINQKIYDKINSKHIRLIEQAKSIVKSSFNDPNLSLGTVADKLHISMNYLSSLFKKETGQSFTQYLTNYRIDKAKELLKTSDFKTYEVAYEVGYEDPQYFSTVFKKIVGVSPSEYKESVKR